MSVRRYKQSFGEWSFYGLGYVLLFVFGMLCVIPFYLILISSFAEESALLRNGFQLVRESFRKTGVAGAFANSLRHIAVYKLLNTKLDPVERILTDGKFDRERWNNEENFSVIDDSVFISRCCVRCGNYI